MEDYSEMVTFTASYGEESETITEPRLFIVREVRGYGWVIKDRKVLTDQANGSIIKWWGKTKEEAEKVLEGILNGNSPPMYTIPTFDGRVLVAHEKHGQRIFSVPTLNHYEVACRKLFKERYEAGWYHEPVNPDPDGLTESDIDILPECLKYTARQKLLALTKWERAAYRSELGRWKTIKKAMAGDDAAIMDVLCFRENHEYERIELVDAEIVDIN